MSKRKCSECGVELERYEGQKSEYTPSYNNWCLNCVSKDRYRITRPRDE
jgi:hypothetical protein